MDFLNDITNNSVTEYHIIDIHQTEALSLQSIKLVAYISVLEYFLLWIQGKPFPKLHENILSFAHGLLCETARLVLRVFEYNAYTYLWQYSLWPNLFTNSFQSFLLSVVLIDFCYYWFHRANHEIMIFWAVHQVHHSSEEFTVAVNLRHSPLQYAFSWIFYLPLALLGLSPSHMVFHQHLNLIYQTWVHTTVTISMSWLEYILNTPSHHRVHHGSDKYCINVNYSGIFILWDHIFGTFEKEKPNERITYGVVNQPVFWNPLYHQFYYIEYMAHKAGSMSNWWHWWCAVVKGPSWMPGSSWVGRELYIGCDRSRRRIWCNTSLIINSYAIIHLISSYIILSFVIPDQTVNIKVRMLFIALVVTGLANIGMLYEGKTEVKYLEKCRCLAGWCASLLLATTDYEIKLYLTSLFIASTTIWLLASPTGQLLRL